jgi:membrane fusion protein (multidrug efflux system)
MKASSIPALGLALLSLSLPACHREEGPQEHQQKILVTTPKAKDVTLTRQYVCQIHAQRHINVRALQDGYLQEILVNEGQAVKKGDLLFKILPTLYQARYKAEAAEAKVAELEYKYAGQLANKNYVSQSEVALLKAKLEKAQAKAKLAEAELNFTNVTAPFDGIVDRLHEREGSLIKERDILTTLSDTSVLWVYFNVPEKQYFEYMAGQSQDAYKRGVGQGPEERKIELVLADGSKFNQLGKIGAIEAKFNNETGNIPFRADFPNPDRLLRHGQTGTILIHRTLKNATVIPQRAVFEILDKQYVYVVDDQDVVHQREIVVQKVPGQKEIEDIFVIKKGLDVNDRIVLEGVRQVHDGQKLEEPEFCPPDEALAHQKNPAE